MSTIEWGPWQGLNAFCSIIEVCQVGEMMSPAIRGCCYLDEDVSVCVCVCEINLVVSNATCNVLRY